MHIAICFWGLLRALQFTVKNIEQEILLPIQSYGHTYDIFIHTYSLHGVYRSERNKEDGKVLNISDWKLLSPQYIYIEDQDAFDAQISYSAFQLQGDPWKNNFTSFQNHMRALNSLYHVTKAVEAVVKQAEEDQEKQKSQQGSTHSHTHSSPSASHSSAINPPTPTGKKYYDAILFLRPDVQFLSELPIQLLATLPLGTGLESKKPVLFLPDFHRSCHGLEYNDRFALGTLSGGLIYGKKLETAYEFSKQAKLHAEKFTYWHLMTKFHVKVIEIPFRFRRIRSNGETHKRDYEVTSPDEHDRYVKKGIVYTGKVEPTVWYMRWFYTFVEYVTFGQMYVWNHDDNGNLYCDPHHKLSNKQVKHLKKIYPPPYQLQPVSSESDSESVGQKGTNNKEQPDKKQPAIVYFNTINPNHFECEVSVEEVQMHDGIVSKRLVPKKCQNVGVNRHASSGSSGGVGGLPASGRHHSHSEVNLSQVHNIETSIGLFLLQDEEKRNVTGNQRRYTLGRSSMSSERTSSFSPRQQKRRMRHELNGNEFSADTLGSGSKPNGRHQRLRRSNNNRIRLENR
jgi:hypothetical protein